ncbi:uncharacterized protein BDR25DRAFT_378566 [Lindgomyces ingoldianus]|uniref:Uncharacterized protein n=1 Tax=Lindgomyces ingoldianus TaxID=673940 RepID=A0ACB6QET5_9PLEO|nr:uncharacterized protein BDR25DRAFT_378566 [Lindgomyces ingoldianus]KAF2465401.1 hypothetical protein BDR25DRAFT_378566 [Lindgomyces ingoldianus]
MSKVTRGPACLPGSTPEGHPAPHAPEHVGARNIRLHRATKWPSKLDEVIGGQSCRNIETQSRDSCGKLLLSTKTPTKCALYPRFTFAPTHIASRRQIRTRPGKDAQKLQRGQKGNLGRAMQYTFCLLPASAAIVGALMEEAARCKAKCVLRASRRRCKRDVNFE